jgi:AraC-like DNA-binding protein
MRQVGEDNRGIIHPQRGLSRFRLTRVAPAAGLALYVERHWVVEWDLRGREPFVQQVLPHPTVHLVVEPEREGVWGVQSRRTSHRLAGRGRAVGTKFRPGGFAPLAQGPVSDLTDRVLPLAEAFGEAGEELVRRSRGADDHHEAIAAHEAFLLDRLPLRDERVAEVARVAEAMRRAPPATALDDLAAGHNLSVRTLQRRFRDYVGVGPKWVLQRYRLHDAAERMAAGEVADWSRLALDLGYFDQAHFVNDFSAAIGTPPAEYAAECAAARERMAA